MGKNFLHEFQTINIGLRERENPHENTSIIIAAGKVHR